jgi:GTP cyclohydrolase I
MLAVMPSEHSITTDAMTPLHDAQSTRDTRELPIDKVGVRGVRFPIQVRDRAHVVQNTIATVGLFVDLPMEFKGTHMSRFIEVLHSHGGMIHVENIPDLLARMQERLKANTSHLEMEFPYFITKKAPATGLEGLMDYTVRFEANATGSSIDFVMTVRVAVTTLCPCSKAISQHGAHNQRSHVTVSVKASAFIWIEEIIDIVEKEASCELYGLLKRPDEKYVTEKAYDNPKFVEDLVRDVAGQLNQDERINGYVVEAENFESIHNHSAYAQITFTRDN